jgi:hypothetical protein
MSTDEEEQPRAPSFPAALDQEFPQLSCICIDRDAVFLQADFGAVVDNAIWGNGLCRSADMNPHQSQAFILDVPVAQV